MSLGQFGKIAVGWSVITFAGVYAFIFSKSTVDRRRYEDMQIRDRMRKANLGNYEAVSSRSFTG